MTADLLVRLFNPQAAAYPPHDDFWYGPVGSVSGAGLTVTAETALKVSTFFACLRAIGESVLSAPLFVYRRLPNGDRDQAPEHPLWPLLHGDDPNDDQTSVEWTETHTIHTAMRGWSYSRIRPGPRGPVDSLEYLHPDRVTQERLPNGVKRYKVRNEINGTTETLNAEQVFAFPGVGGGLSVLDYARETLGISQALQQYAGSNFRHGGRHSAVLEFPGTFKDQDAAERLRKQWEQTYGGAANAGKTVILENDMKYKGISMSPNDMQMLASEQWQVSDVARWFRMPLVMVGEQESTSNWGTGVQQYQIGFVTFTMLPWFIRYEKRINKQLVQPLGGDYFSEFSIEGLLRGDIKSRFEAYQIAVGGNGPWMSRQEVRRKENLNQGPRELDDFLQPMNMIEAGMEPTPRGTVPRQAALLPPADPRLKGYATAMARQIVHKETQRVQQLAKRYADDGAGWEQAVREFYSEQARGISEKCYVHPTSSSSYASGWCERLLQNGAGVIESWEQEKTDELLGLMLREGAGE
jgi:HK97 family phage portal protein